MARRSGFTLIELTVVMAIITLLLTMAVGAHYAWKRHARLDTAAMRAESAMALARQTAVSTGRPALYVFGNGDLPLPEDSVESRASLDLWQAGGAEEGDGEPSAGWCCVLALTNALDEADAWEALGRESVFPVVGRPVELEEPVLWAGEDGEVAGGEVFVHLFLPDGGLSLAPEGLPSPLVAAPWTNALLGVAADGLEDPDAWAAQTRVLWVRPRTGVTGQLSREEREAYWR